SRYIRRSDRDAAFDHRYHRRVAPQAHIEFGSKINDLGRSGEYVKWAVGVVPDLESCLAGCERYQALRRAVLDRCRGIRIQVQYRTIRQSMGLLFAVARRKMQRRGAGGTRLLWNGSQIPQEEQAKNRLNQGCDRDC